MNRILVSVCMITYGHEKFIEQAIGSIMKQKGDFDLELVISNDCSPDKTDKIVKKLEEKYTAKSNHKIKYFNHKKNLGVNHNFVFALKECKGKYIAICEGDDYWIDPFKLNKQIRFLENNPEYVLTHHNAKIVSENGDIISTNKLPIRNKDDFSNSELQKGPFLLTLSLCFRNLLKDYPKEFYGVLNADKFLISLLGKYGGGKFMNNIKPAAYRSHNGGIWSNIHKENKLKAKLKTYYSLYLYYKRKNKKDISEYFYKQYIKVVKMLFLKYFKRLELKPMFKLLSGKYKI